MIVQGYTRSAALGVCSQCRGERVVIEHGQTPMWPVMRARCQDCGLHSKTRPYSDRWRDTGGMRLPNEGWVKGLVIRDWLQGDELQGWTDKELQAIYEASRRQAEEAARLERWWEEGAEVE